MQNRSVSCLSSDGVKDLWKNLWRSSAKLKSSQSISCTGLQVAENGSLED